MSNDCLSESPSPLPYGENVSMTELAFEAIVTGFKARYERRAFETRNLPNPKRTPPDEVIFKMARFVQKRSIEDGHNDHLGTAEPLK